jgi:hypothetical protein
VSSEQNVVLEFQAIVVVSEVHFSHANSSINRTDSDSLGLWPHSNAHDWTVKIALAVEHLLLLDESLEVDNGDSAVVATDDQVRVTEVRHEWDALELSSGNRVSSTRLPENHVLISSSGNDHLIVLETGHLHAGDVRVVGDICQLPTLNLHTLDLSISTSNENDGVVITPVNLEDRTSDVNGLHKVKTRSSIVRSHLVDPDIS